jgi:DNA-binding beta-propeller fold protein YncE
MTPGECVLNADGSKLYVGNVDTTSGARIFVVHTSNLLIKEGLNVQAGPHHLILGAADQQLYVAHEEIDWITVIDTENDFVRREFSLTGGAPAVSPRHRPRGLALSPNSNELWASCSASNQVRVYSSTNGSLIDSVSTLAAPQQIAMTADGSKLYVPCRDAGGILVFNTQNRLFARTIINQNIAQPSGCALSPDGKYVFVSSTNTAGAYRARRVSAPRGNLVVIDAARDVIVKIIETQEQPFALSVNN